MQEEIKKSTIKKVPTKKSSSKTTLKNSTPSKKKPSTKTISPVKKNETSKSLQNKSSSKNTIKKATTKKESTNTPKETPLVAAKKTSAKSKNTTVSKSNSLAKTASRKLESDDKSIKTSSRAVKNTKKVLKPKAKGRVKKQEELSTLEALEQAIEHSEITEKQPLGKTFYLFFAIVLYAGAFFYINNIVYDNSDMLQSAIFAFAAVFIFFVLMLFNVHMLVFNFFFLPFKRMFKQSRREIHKEIIFSVGKNKVQTTFNKYKSLFTLILYGLFAGFLMYFSIKGSIMEGDKVLKIVTDAGLTLLIFLAVVCSWQYLFNIIPSILDKSIDARNGFILTLSGVILVVYIVFLLLDIVYLSEIMIFLLMIGFVALLGVNLNMIIGEINIFQNLRGRKSKVITRVVFIVFFGFHIYVILYASVVAYSIYNWEPQSYVFSTYDYSKEIVTDLESPLGDSLSTVYWDNDADQLTSVVPLTEVYWDHDEDTSTPVVLLTEFYNVDFKPVRSLFNASGNRIILRNQYGDIIDSVVPSTIEDAETCDAFYNDGEFACVYDVKQPHTYGDFLYWTVVTVSTIGYGDIHPSTEYNIAMGWGGFLGIYGLTFFALSISFVSNIAMEGVNSVREENKKND